MFSLFDREFSSYWNPNQRSRGLPTISDGEEEEEEAEEEEAEERERERVCVCVCEWEKELWWYQAGRSGPGLTGYYRESPAASFMEKKKSVAGVLAQDKKYRLRDG